MPWKGVTVNEERRRFLQEFRLGYYSLSRPVRRLRLREGLARSKRRFRRAHPGCPKSSPQSPNDIWAADYKGQFRLKNGQYCFPLTVSDLASRYLLGVATHERMHRPPNRKPTTPPASSLPAQQRRFDAFRKVFNELRPHESLAMQRPAQLYRPSTRAFPRRIAPYDYPSHFLVRRVSRDSNIRVLRTQI